jgi:spore coat polysaccharide biosynthesis protein SpsF
MKAVILIAVRLNSKRLARKALIQLGEKTILEHLITRVKDAKEPEGLVICTSVHQEDREIINLAENIGIKWFAGSENDVLDRFIRAAEREGAQAVIRVTGDNPFTDPQIMDDMVALHRERGAEYTYTEDIPRGTRCEILDVSAMKRAHLLAENPSQTEYMSLFFRQPEFFRVSTFNVSHGKLKKPHYRLTLDTLEDLKLIRILYESLYDHHKEKFPPLEKIIEFLDVHPDIVSINQHISPKWEKMEVNVRLRRS